MENNDFIIFGWDAIADVFKVSKQTMIKRKDELMEYGAIFYQYKGRPPRRVVCAFPSMLKTWAGTKTTKGNIF